jgi:hypothetical protein
MSMVNGTGFAENQRHKRGPRRIRVIIWKIVLGAGRALPVNTGLCDAREIRGVDASYSVLIGLRRYPASTACTMSRARSSWDSKTRTPPKASYIIAVI